ncbi:MAG TPA: HAD-IA family hydrolase, partial [Spirochaetia bacterium]|nr:HAD-IA family hydrolase [Spirochaetia bacterium]
MLRYNLSGSIRCVLFDFDGTLTAPNGLDFAEIRKRMGCPAGESILEFIESSADDDSRAFANRVLEEAEAEAARMATLRDGAADYVMAVRKRGVRTGIITRNSRVSIDRSFENFSDLSAADFDVIVTRDEALRAKPHPDGVLYVARKFGIDCGRIALIGDFRYDMESARAAGALAVYFAGTSADEPPPQSDIVVRS